ncbi:MAG: hypothetical protein K2M94_04610 [Paramuribaculum sp.]|nr:hypothetical protein [Paramuribaculum sp.]
MRKLCFLAAVLLTAGGCRSQKEVHTSVEVDSSAVVVSRVAVKKGSVDSLTWSGCWELDDVMITVHADSGAVSRQAVVNIKKAVLTRGGRHVVKRSRTDSSVICSDVVLSRAQRSSVQSEMHALSPSRWFLRVIGGILAVIIVWCMVKLFRRKRTQ